MIQADLLIATYEHAHGLTKAAYIFIGTCAKWAMLVASIEANSVGPLWEVIYRQCLKRTRNVIFGGE